MNGEAIVWTEGKTDCQHLRRAFEGLGVRTRVDFKELDGDFGDDRLLKQCSALALEAQTRPTIFIFDRDKDEIVRQVEDPQRGFKAWGNNVYSFAIPIPAHRKDQSAICIELYYTDNELRTTDDAGRRLFLPTEFNPGSGRLRSNAKLSIGNKGKLRSARIIDSDVYDDQEQNVALSKADFAKNVVAGVGAFGAFRFEAFQAIVSKIESIIDEARPKIDLPFSDLQPFLKSLEDLDTEQQFAAVVKAVIRACKLTAMTFVAATVRHYEQRIVSESSTDAKKVQPIKQVLASSFGHPSLVTLQRLARYCYHLIDEHAPSEVHTLHALMATTPVLGPVGDLLDDLEALFGPPRVRIVSKSQLRKPILDYVIRELSKYEVRIPEISELFPAVALRASDRATWGAALSTLIGWFTELRSLPFRVRTIARVHNDSDEFDILLRSYREDKVQTEETRQTYQDLKGESLETYELLLTAEEGETALDLFPFIVIGGDRLLYYERTTAHGYKYSAVFGPSGDLKQTKRKFSHAALRTLIAFDLQALFWKQMTPSVSEFGVKANIPEHSSIVGRKQQIATIMEEIVEIPNQNGIIYGPGGVGKTALLMELSHQLFEEEVSESVRFKNIIWVLAKQDYYDPRLGLVEPRRPQFGSLDNVLTAILEFLGFEDASGYESDLKKGLVLESLRDERTFLILDNFESVAPSGQKEIIRFFDVDAKIALRDKPDYLKVLVTSRESIASTFLPIRLKGLDKRSSKKLMKRLYEPYARSGKQQLTDEQFDALFEATQGIPLIIGHCYGQVYEHSRPFDVVLKTLSSAGSKIVDFSFAEIFKLLKQNDLQLRTILLLELSGRRLMARQIADILGANEEEILTGLTSLVNFQCVTTATTGTDEKYGISDDVRLLTRRLAQEYATLATEIKRQIANLPLEKRMDYSQQEADFVLAFQDYISQGHYVMAEDFITERLRDYADSVLLNLHYAKYLKEIKGRTEKAIERLEGIRLASGSDQQVLRLLMNYYTALDTPNFEQAHSYARELEEIAVLSKEIENEIAQFYVAWSTALKMKVELDPLEEIKRQQKYKELAATAITLLKDVDLGTHEWHYLLAQSYYNHWDKKLALHHIDKAIAAIPTGSQYAPYRRLRREIQRKLTMYPQRRSA
jgi:Cdc6-like AAA superfamily ATPase